VALGSAVVVIAVVALVAFNYLKPARSERDEAINVADQIVEQYFPDYAGAQRTVSDWEWGDQRTVYLVTYSFEADEANGYPFPRALNVYLDSETQQVRIEEMN
jgi:hypothetical protein